MNTSGVCLSDIGGDCHQHFVRRHRDSFDLAVGKLEYNLPGVNADLNIPVRPSPLIGDGNGLDGIHIFQFGHE